MSISELKLEEIPEILKLRALIQESIPNEAFFNWSEEAFKNELKLARVWVFKNSDHETQAFLAFRETADQIEIMVLGTSPVHRQSGAMKALITRLQDYAAQQGAAIGLEVHEANQPARQLYLKLDFQSLYRRKNYYKDGGAAEIFLWKKPAARE